MKTALFVDFEDSFSFNVVQELTEAGFLVDVIKWFDLNRSDDYDLLVLGPGPGHPDDYANIYSIVRERLTSQKKIFGVCLGHQMIWSIKGCKIGGACLPLHGQRARFFLNESWQNWLGLPQEIWVQRYNSLAVKVDEVNFEGDALVVDGELMMYRDQSVISYQFHPESMGTNCRQSFFRPLLRDLL